MGWMETLVRLICLQNVLGIDDVHTVLSVLPLFQYCF